MYHSAQTFKERSRDIFYVLKAFSVLRIKRVVRTEITSKKIRNKAFVEFD